MKDYKITFLQLFNFFYFRVLCHVRPEFKFLKANLLFLKLGEALKKLPSNVTNVSGSESEAIEQYASVIVSIFNMFRECM